MRLFSLLLLSLLTTNCFSQKSLIDSSVYAQWPCLAVTPSISNDGSYCIYRTYTVTNSSETHNRWVVKSTVGSWEMELPEVSGVVFSQDSRLAIFMNAGDNLGIITLGTSSVSYIPHVRSFRLHINGSGEWLAYLSDSVYQGLVIRDLTTGQQHSFIGVTNYLFSGDGKLLLLGTTSKKDSAIVQSLDWISLADDRRTRIWEGSGQASNFVLQGGNMGMAFTVTSKQNAHSFWYFKSGLDIAMFLADDRSPGVDSGLVLDHIIDFSSDNSRLFISLRETDPRKPKEDVVKVDIWGYRDARLQSEQLQELAPHSYTAVMSLADHRVIRLDQDRDDQIVSAVPPHFFSDYILILNLKGTRDEWNWNSSAQLIAYLVSTHDGSRKQIINGSIKKPISTCLLSPGGKYVIFYDVKLKNCFSYAVSSGIVRNITQGIDAEWTAVGDEMPQSAYWMFPIAGWTADDENLLLYDRYDLWKIDPAGQRPAVNLTNEYGRRHGIVFRVEEIYGAQKTAIWADGTILLKAFDNRTKDDGFYQKKMNQRGDPELLTMGRYLYDIPPVKARDAEAYLISRMSAMQHPNLFLTSNFKQFTPVTSIYPERSYNWMTSELVTWKTLNGSLSQGVLYKPENFDRKKKYPIIFLYYERLSDELNLYRAPEASDGRINIPTFVSNGYLVFTPDIHYRIGEPGESVVNAVESAAKYLSKLPWVDARRMGINGHSFGGYETNYLVTHSHLFAAAVSGSGPSDLMASYGELWGGYSGPSKEEYYELRDGRIGATLWQRPDLYIRNSPIFKADRVTMPVLLMNNKQDGGVPFSQGVEFFTALRRLGKKAWMLQYDNMGHNPVGKAAMDYNIRVTQFFDHYLKGSPPPRWMTEGIPASRKGLDSGFELDTRPGVVP